MEEKPVKYMVSSIFITLRHELNFVTDEISLFWKVLLEMRLDREVRQQLHPKEDQASIPEIVLVCFIKICTPIVLFINVYIVVIIKLNSVLVFFTQWSFQDPATIAGPKLRAGFILGPVYGPYKLKITKIFSVYI